MRKRPEKPATPLTRDPSRTERITGAKMVIIECAAAALIAIALGILIDADTRDTRIRVTPEADTQSLHTRMAAEVLSAGYSGR